MNAELLKKAACIVREQDLMHWPADDWTEKIAEAVLREALEACAALANSEAKYYREEFFRLSNNSHQASLMDAKAICALVIERKVTDLING